MPDPRVRRTRQMLHQGLAKLLQENREFDKISVHEITDAAGLNRATFYDHYPDKLSLLECMVASRFHDLLAQRSVRFDTCEGALNAITQGVCDYLSSIQPWESHMESAIIAVVRGMILEGLKSHPAEGELSPQLIASTASWAIYGAAKEWLQTPGRCPTNQIVKHIETLVSPIFLHLNQIPIHAPKK